MLRDRKPSPGQLNGIQEPPALPPPPLLSPPFPLHSSPLLPYLPRWPQAPPRTGTSAQRPGPEVKAAVRALARGSQKSRPPWSPPPGKVNSWGRLQAPGGQRLPSFLRSRSDFPFGSARSCAVIFTLSFLAQKLGFAPWFASFGQRWEQTRAGIQRAGDAIATRPTRVH